MIDVLFKVLGSGLALWESKEKRKYIDELIGLERAYYEEYNKETPDDASLDVIRFKLQLIGKAFSSKVGDENAKNQ